LLPTAVEPSKLDLVGRNFGGRLGAASTGNGPAAVETRQFMGKQPSVVERQWPPLAPHIP